MASLNRLILHGANITIDRGIPIPPRGVYQRTILSMATGDSFLVPCDPERFRSVQNAVRKAASRVGARVRVRSMTTGVRIWRIA